MSESDKKMEVALKKEDRELLKSAIEKSSNPKGKEKDSMKPEAEKPSHKGHQTISEIIECENCYPEIQKAVFKKEFEDAKFGCVNCGTPVKEEESAKEEWKCKTCGEKYAEKKRD